MQRSCEGAVKSKRVLLYFGSFIDDLLTGLDGSPQGEHIQWHDLYVSLLLTGYQPVLGWCMHCAIVCQCALHVLCCHPLQQLLTVAILLPGQGQALASAWFQPRGSCTPC